MIICEKCANLDCECVPYDVECDENFKPKDETKEMVGRIMREILFRGKRIDNGEWVEGFYGQFHNRPTINEPNIHQIFVPFAEDEEKENQGHFLSAIGGIWHTIIPETIGQYTGLTDKNGKKVFEGDIVLYERDEEYGQIAYHENEAMFVVQFDTWLTNFDHMYGKDLEVIGNIHDNPELFKGGAG